MNSLSLYTPISEKQLMVYPAIERIITFVYTWAESVSTNVMGQ